MLMKILVLFLIQIKNIGDVYKIRIINVKETECIQRDKQLIGKNFSGFIEVVTSKHISDLVVTRKNYDFIPEDTFSETIINIHSDCSESSKSNTTENLDTDGGIPLRTLRKNEENQQFECINQDNDSDDDHDELQFKSFYSIENFLVASLKYFLIENEQNKTSLYFKMTCEGNPFTLYHYKSFKSCFWYFRTLSKKIKLMNFERNNVSVNQKMLSLFSYNKQSESFINKLYERLCLKYESQLYDQMQVQLTESDLKNLVEILINELSAVKRFFIITSTYTEEKYVEVFAIMIIDLIKKYNDENNSQQILEYFNENIKLEINNIQYHIESELSTFDYLIEQVCYVNQIYPRNNINFETLEKIICDYCNLCFYLLSLQSKTTSLHLAPNKNSNQEFKLIKMIEIELEKYSFINDVICCDSNGVETVLEINKDVFVGRNYRTLYLFLNLILEKNTQYLRIHIDDKTLVIIDLKNHQELLPP